MKNKYQQILENEGQEAATSYMRNIRSKVKNHPGGSFNDPEFAKKAREIRKQNEDQQATGEPQAPQS